MMETIKVNMNPNPLDVQTIHASQNDGEARQWGFELHNNGDVIDSSEVTEQITFKAYEGGTEQILPENGSTPTTSPFIGDIKYPQGLLTDQEFTYRESPTESDGLAKITDIKGNTLVWNQQMDSSRYNTGTYSGVAVTKSTDETYLIANGTATANAYVRLFNVASFPMISGHKYLCVVPNDPDVAYYDDTSPRQYDNQYSSFVFTSNGSPIRPYARINNGVASTNRRISFMMFDLTQMGLDITDPSDFTSLFSLPYYSYNKGTLLSFNGNGLKTVGFNQWDEEWEVGAYNSADGSKADNVRDRIRNKNPIRIFPSVNYYKNKGLQVYYYDASMNFIGWNSLDSTGIFTPPSNARYMNFNGLAGTGTTYNNDICINISDPSKNGTYEPYTSSTLSLPISTYFSNGMKSAGSVYDELTETKAITRIGSVDLGSLTWTRTTSYTNPFFYTNMPTDCKYFYNDSTPNATSIYSVYQVKASNVFGTNAPNKSFTIYSYANQLFVRDDTYTDATAFKQAMTDQNVKLYYELATESETSFTTASLVTENAEIPLSNNDGVLIGKCTEQLSSDSGFFDTKIKLADADGECYSNKIQLHIERSPQ